jgi:DEAD/DEAH box helicase domain-containing protein
MTILEFPPRELKGVLDELRNDRNFMKQVALWKEIKPAEAQYRDFPGEVSPKLKSVLASMGIKKLYCHQEEAYQSVRSGENVVVVTPTASGKTLCYNLPVVQSILEDPAARALYLFPTKALSQDQVVELQEIIDLLEEDIKTYTFDGDTPPAVRTTIRASGHIVVTNPDMLHQGILPHHTRWVKLFENLRYVVIDEVHHYRGVFGSHLANVIRRLKRICAFYRSRPQFICCSATIANPRELAEKIIEEPARLIDRNGAPRETKHFIFYNPPVVNQQLGIRRSVIHEATRIAQRFLSGGIQTILFARSRLNVEILLTYLREAMTRQRKPADLIRGYRSGYLPKERRAIENGLRNGSVRGVVSTNALELGIDIGQLDCCIMVGYPGTVSSTWQQAGRAGRKSGVSAALLVASSHPLDQYIVNHPDYFFSQSPEKAVVNPNNLVILMSHVKCAAFELPFEDGERFGIDTTGELLEYLEEHGVLHYQDRRFHWTSEVYPAEEVSLRSASTDNFVIVDTTTKDHKVIGEMDLFSAPLLLHQEAIYVHQGQQCHVDTLDWERRKAYVRRVDVDYYTDAEVKTDIKVLDMFQETAEGSATRAHGEVSVTTTPTQYKKIKFGSHENIGYGKITLPELEMHTTSYMWQLEETIESELKRDGLDFAAGMKGLGAVMGTVAALYVMCDPQDIRAVPMLKSPFHRQATIFIYECYPGGVGFSEKLYEMHRDLLEAARDLIRACPCDAGCPSCVGPALEVGPSGKLSTVRIIEKGMGRW